MASPPRRSRTTSSETQFEPPNPPVPPAGGADDGQFEPPPGDNPAQQAGGEDSGFQLAYDADPSLLQVKQEVERQIFARGSAVSTAARSQGSESAATADELITGVGIGPAHRDFESVGSAGPGAPVLNVYVTEKLDMETTKRLLVDDFGARALAADSQPVNVIFTGPIDAQAHRHRERPAPCGISVGHHLITAGTLGALARGRSGARRNRLLILSNNHVLANVNSGQAGDPILQPGTADQGKNPADRIAILERWVTINFSASAQNLVDCGTAWAWPNLVRPEFVFRSGAGWSYFRVGAQTTAAAIGMPVGKSGRTTQLTSGRVIDVNASIRVNFGPAGAANFRDQITIKGNSGLFSRGGDSGSLIWTWDARRNPVGLLFAGGGEFTFANKINHVLDSLDINLHT